MSSDKLFSNIHNRFPLRPGPISDSAILEAVCLARGHGTLRSSSTLFLGLEDGGAPSSLLGFRVTSSLFTSQVAIQIASDREARSNLLMSRGFSVPQFRSFRLPHARHAKRFAERIGKPVVVRPITGTNRTLVEPLAAEEVPGVFKASDPSSLASQKRHARGRLLVQEYVPGTQLSVIVANGRPVATTVRGADRIESPIQLDDVHGDLLTLATEVFAAIPGVLHGEVVIAVEHLHRERAHQRCCVLCIDLVPRMVRTDVSMEWTIHCAESIVAAHLGPSSTFKETVSAIWSASDVSDRSFFVDALQKKAKDLDLEIKWASEVSRRVAGRISGSPLALASLSAFGFSPKLGDNRPTLIEIEL